MDRSDKEGIASGNTRSEYHRAELKVLIHGIYEIQKGVRNLVLCTICRTSARIITAKLQNCGISYLQQPLSEGRVNLYFGRSECLDAVSAFIHKPLNTLSAEEDFMLGAMLGYDIPMQCKRFCRRRSID